MNQRELSVFTGDLLMLMH